MKFLFDEFWDKAPKYTDVERITVKELDKFIKKEKVVLKTPSNNSIARNWEKYARYFAFNNGLDDVSSDSFCAVVLMFLAGYYTSFDTDYVFQEHSIRLAVADFLNDLNEKDLSHIEIVRNVFEFIFCIYSENISRYEFQTQRFGFRCSPRQYRLFMGVEGHTKSEKFVNLLDFYYLNR